MTPLVAYKGMIQGRQKYQKEEHQCTGTHNVMFKKGGLPKTILW